MVMLTPSGKTSREQPKKLPFEDKFDLFVYLIFLQPMDLGVAGRQTLLLETNPRKFDESSIFGADQHEMYYIARVLVDSHTFHPDWPYRDQVKAALAECHNL